MLATEMREQGFARVLARTGDREYAAIKAGYSHPRAAASKLLARQRVQDMTRAEAERFAREQAGQLGLGVLVDLAMDASAPAATRRAAAKDLLDVSGLATSETGQRDLAGLTGAELEAELTRARARLIAGEHLKAERAHPVIDGQVDTIVPSSGLFD